MLTTEGILEMKEHINVRSFEVNIRFVLVIYLLKHRGLIFLFLGDYVKPL